MSRRFGRNQRRRAREALAHAINQNHGLEQSLDVTLKFLRDVARQKDYLQNALQDIAEMLPEGSALLPTSRLLVPDRDISKACRDRLMIDVQGHNQPGSMFSTFRVEQLIAAVATISESSIDNRLHFEVEFADKRTAYAMTASALKTMPRERLHEFVRNNIAEQLTRKLMEILGK